MDFLYQTTRKTVTPTQWG